MSHKRSQKSRSQRSRKKAPAKRSKTNVPSIKASTVLLYLLVFVNSVLIVSSAHKLIRDAEDGVIQPTEVITIEVLNGCGENNAANNMSNKLNYLNYNVVNTGNADHFSYEHTMIIDLGSDKERAVEKLRKDMGVSQDRVFLIREEAEAEVRVILGKDFENLKIYNSVP